MNEAQAGTAAQEPTLASAIARLESLRNACRELAGSTEIARENLVGSVPTPVSSQKDNQSNATAIYRLHLLIEELAEYQSQTHRDVYAIQRAIGCEPKNQTLGSSVGYQRIR